MGSILRKYIRQTLLEDLEAFKQDLSGDPKFNHNWSDRADEDDEPEEDILLGYHGRAAQGRIIKKAFAKHADRDFLKTLKLVHWTNDKAKLIKALQTPRSRDELSAAAYLPDTVEPSAAFGRYGLIVNGHITLLSNDMNDIQSGHSEFYRKANPERARSSGANKGIGVVANDSIVLSKEDWDNEWSRSFLGNEALVDNWEATGVIIPDEDYDEMVEVFDELYDKTGKEYNLYKASMLE